MRERDRPPYRPDDHPLSVAVSQRMVRLRVSLTVVAAIATALGMAATNMYSYVRGIEEERRLAQAEVTALKQRLDDHETAVADLVQKSADDTKARQQSLQRMAHVQILEWRYIAKLIEAARARKPMPEKPPELVSAELQAESAIRIFP